MTEQLLPKVKADDVQEDASVGKHTPGPWDPPHLTSDGASYFIPDGANWDVCEIRIAYARLPEVAKANAILIAAAPLMADYISKRAAGGDSEAEKIMEAIHAN